MRAITMTELTELAAVSNVICDIRSDVEAVRQEIWEAIGPPGGSASLALTGAIAKMDTALTEIQAMMDKVTESDT